MKKKRSVKIKVKKVKRFSVGNTARPIRIVYSFDGMLEPIIPSRLRAAMKELAQEVNWKGADYILSFDGAAVIPATVLSEITNLPLRVAYKLDLALPGKIRFTEPYAVTKNIFAYGVKRGDKVILVDDEIYSGESMVLAVKELQKAGVKIKAIVCVVESTRHGARKKIQKLKIPFISHSHHHF